jgi:hypothetical protein
MLLAPLKFDISDATMADQDRRELPRSMHEFPTERHEGCRLHRIPHVNFEQDTTSATTMHLLSLLASLIDVEAHASLPSCIKPTYRMISMELMPPDQCAHFCEMKLRVHHAALSLQNDGCFNPWPSNATWTVEYHNLHSSSMADNDYRGYCVCHALLTPTRQSFMKDTMVPSTDLTMQSSSLCSLRQVSERLSFDGWEVTPLEKEEDLKLLDCETSEEVKQPESFEIVTREDLVKYLGQKVPRWLDEVPKPAVIVIWLLWGCQLLLEQLRNHGRL